MLTVYGRATSSNVQAVMWGIGELGLPHERLDYGHVHGGLDSDEYLAMNPHGLVPTLKDGDVAIWESCAILRYLAARYGDGGAFWPADPVARAQVDMWAEWGKGTIAAAFTVPIFWARVRTAARDRNAAALAQGLRRFDAALGRLGAQIEAAGGLVAGPDLTLADIVCGHVMFRYFDIDIPRDPPPAIRDWYDRLAERPAFRAHVMVPYDVLRHPEAG